MSFPVNFLRDCQLHVPPCSSVLIEESLSQKCAKTVQSLAKNLLNQWQEDGVIEPLSELMLVSSSSQLSCDPLGFLK
jgi:hypothetical protein